MLLSDKTIKALCVGKGSDAMLTPFTPESISKLETGHPTTSFGLSSYGYDLRLGNHFKTLIRPENLPGARFIDPTAFDNTLLQDSYVEDGFVFVVPPSACVLAATKERIIMPPDVSGVCMQKSTIARSFLEVTVTPLEAGWEGYLTLELHNKTPYPLHLRPGMGIVQLLFYKGDQMCEVPYGARNGKYHNQPAYPVSARSMHDGPVGDTSELGILSERTFARTSNSAKETQRHTASYLAAFAPGESRAKAEQIMARVSAYPEPEESSSPVWGATVESLANAGKTAAKSIQDHFQKAVSEIVTATNACRDGLAQRVMQSVERAAHRTVVEVDLQSAVEKAAEREEDVTKAIQNAVLKSVRSLTEERMNELVDGWATATKGLLEFGTIVCQHKTPEDVDATVRHLKEAYHAQLNAGAEEPTGGKAPDEVTAAADVPSVPTPLSQAMDTLERAIAEDHEYAWSWYSNIAMPIYDSLPAEINLGERLHMARYAAFVLMLHLFKVDIAQNPIAKTEHVPTTQAGMAVTLTLHARNQPVTEEAVIAASTPAPTAAPDAPTAEKVVDEQAPSPAQKAKLTYADLKQSPFDFQPIYVGAMLNATMEHADVLLNRCDSMFFSDGFGRYGALLRKDMPEGIFDMLHGTLLVQFIYNSHKATEKQLHKACELLLQLGCAGSHDPAHLRTAEGLLVVAERLQTVLRALGLQLPTFYGELVQALRAKVMAEMDRPAD